MQKPSDESKEVKVKVRVIFSRSETAQPITPEERIAQLKFIFTEQAKILPGYTVGGISKCAKYKEAFCVDFTRLGDDGPVSHPAGMDEQTLGLVRYIVLEGTSLSPACVSVEVVEEK